jgi:pimeloyl-ACP methyl ester carboxylesterase
MRRLLTLIAAAAITAALPAPAAALCQVSACAPDGRQESGAAYRICLPEPSCWNGDLVVVAHAYVDSARPVAIPEEQLLFGGVSVPRLVNRLGYAFAVTSYRANGLAVLEGVEDVADLVDVFAAAQGRPRRAFLIGASEGGLITTLALEQRLNVFDAGVAACAPIGDFRAAIDHAGDFRAVFDYFFPGLVPGTAVDVPAEVRRDWEAVYLPLVQDALRARPEALRAVFDVTGAAWDPHAPETLVTSALDLLTYGVYAGPDAAGRLGGSPYDNRARVYRGSPDDAALNARIRRYEADPAALAEIAAHYETTGRLERPLVTLHTRRDPLVPQRQSLLYARKVRRAGAADLQRYMPALRYGHCAFNVVDGLLGFAAMLRMAAAPVPSELQAALSDRGARRRLLSASRR